jgi:hypothetical protein
MKAMLHLYVGGNPKARLWIAHGESSQIREEPAGGGGASPLGFPRVEPKPCLRLPSQHAKI